MAIKLLDFIVIGAAKSGTTSLFHHLRHHPQIYLPSNKEAPFFSDEELFKRGWGYFVEENFSQAPLGALWGKITPAYMGNPKVPERIFQTMPGVKLTALLRNPIDRAYSYYRMMVRSGDEKRTFEEACTRQLREDALEEARYSPTLERTESYVVRSEYGRILSNFLLHFPREQLLILFSDDLEQHPQFALNKLLDFFGLAQDFTPPNLRRKYFVGGECKRFPWLLPTARCIPPFRCLWKSLPQDTKRYILFWFHNEFNIVKQPAPQLPASLRHRLITFYQSDIRKLERLLGQEVPWLELRQTL